MFKSKIANNYQTKVGDTFNRMPSALSINTASTAERPEQQQAAPVSNNYAGAAPTVNDQQTSINRPTVGADNDYSEGIDGIARMGQAATAEVQIKADNRANEQMQETNSKIQSGLQSGIDASLGGQEGVSLSPKLGSNGSASWINSNNGKYHDFDGAYGAQCVDLYNFYMTGFVGGRSSVGTISYANELWGKHDSKSLVQVAKNQTPQMGDIAIWSNSFNGVGGHVAIVAQDNGNGTIRVLNANATSKGSAGNTVMSNLSTGTLMGYLRPRKLM